MVSISLINLVFLQILLFELIDFTDEIFVPVVLLK